MKTLDRSVVITTPEPLYPWERDPIPIVQEAGWSPGLVWMSAENLTQILSTGAKITHSLTPRRYNPCRVLADSRSRLQLSLSLALLFQFLTPSLSASLITPSSHLRFGLPTCLLPSGLSKVIFLHGRLSCICTICPAHLSLVILTVVTKSVSSYR